MTTPRAAQTRRTVLRNPAFKKGNHRILDLLTQKNRSETRSPPASSGQMPRNPTREVGSNPNVPDASDGKNPLII